MGVFTFVCRNLGGSWTAKQQEGDLVEASASSIAKEDNEENEVSEEASASEDIVGGIPIVLTTKDPGFVFVCRNGGEEDLEASASKEDNEVFEKKTAEVDILGGIPNVLTDRSTKKPGVVFVLEKASLEVGKIGKTNDHYTYQLLNSYDHAHILRKSNRNPSHYRPDITHRALLSILDSPVNKAGRLKAVYVKTQKGVLFEVKPHFPIPRTFEGFARIILQLPQTVDGKPMQLSSITADGNPERLLRCIMNPVERYLPVNSRKIGFSRSSKKLVNMQKHLSTVCNDTDTVFVLGAMSRGKIECDYIDDFVSISGHRMSASTCISRICEALSTNWNIL